MTAHTRRPPYHTPPTPAIDPADHLTFFNRMRDAINNHEYGYVVASALALLGDMQTTADATLDALRDIHDDLATLNSHGIPALIAAGGDLSDQHLSKLPITAPALLAALQAVADRLGDITEALRQPPR